MDQLAQIHALLARIDHLEEKLDELTRILKNPPYTYKFNGGNDLNIGNEIDA
jgi:hypothetical protein